MSRRKQSKPRQIKRSIGDLDGGEEVTPDDLSLSGEEGGASDPDDSAECDSSSPPPYTPLYNEEPRTQDSHGINDDRGEDEKGRTHSGGEEEEEHDEEEEEELRWRGPVADLELREDGDDSSFVAIRDLHPDTTWGPYPGIIQSDDSTDDQETENSNLTLVCEDADCWLSRVSRTSEVTAANCIIYSQGEELFCKVTRELVVGDSLQASLCPPSSSPPVQLSPPLSLVTQKPLLKDEGLYPAALHSEIQLLPQQAGMAAILATAVVNKDIFPCKDCGIWYRSERNLQAHLMYYCASRQKQPTAAASPPQDKPKESYPNERICPFPQCSKSCPSASSLEIHMRTHSGERPFVCLICLSAFTTKANCERHLKVHTDTLNGVCHGCGFISTTRDILYSHLVTSHMVCQPGSRSEVYSPGPGMPKLPLSIGLSPGDSGVVLKCQVCGHNSDSPAQLQQHVRTHLEVRVPAERSPTPRQSTPTSVDHLQLQLQPSPQDPPASVPRPDSSSPGANGSSATPRGHSPPDHPATTTATLRIKEEPRSDSETEERGVEAERDGAEFEEDHGRKEGNTDTSTCGNKALVPTTSSQSSTSPRSPSAAAVKAEPASPTPGSSPAHMGGAGSVLPGGTVFLPQYMFGPDAAILPQASEILAKMSEMVHSRLKQGQAVPQSSPAAFFAAGAAAGATGAATPHKGATCFECDITFNNINNYYVHKRLYCSSRHQADTPVPGPARDVTPQAAMPRHNSSTSPQRGSASRAASASPADSDPASAASTAAGGAAEVRRPAEVKMETPAGAREGVSSSSEGEGGGGGGAGGRASEGSQSPASGSAEDPDDDPTKTFCEACNIRFSRHDNYTVHKRFYCASRHDPSNQRANHPAKVAAASFMPQPFRTRKRKKMYEIHMARTQALANAAAAAAAATTATASTPSPSGLAVKREASPSAGGSSSPEGDGPIDLSKRPRFREAPRGSGAGGILPALPLTDYHKCTACSISFNSIENYLAHKAYYCPATTLQPHTLEQLHRLKRPASTSPTSRPQMDRLDLLHPAEAKPPTPGEWAPPGQDASPSPRPSALPSSEATSPHRSTPTPAAIVKSEAAGSPVAVCPYCPDRPATSDLVEHFRSVHGLILAVQDEAQLKPGGASPSPSLSPRDGAHTTVDTATSTCATPGPRGCREGINGRIKREAASPCSLLANGSPPCGGGGGPPMAGSPLAVSPTRALSLTVSPAPEAALTMASLPLPVPPPTSIPGPKTPLASPVQNGNTRYCRLCNIKFSSLSTFIAHKKYYCSSHSAEHVK